MLQKDTPSLSPLMKTPPFPIQLPLTTWWYLDWIFCHLQVYQDKSGSWFGRVYSRWPHASRQHSEDGETTAGNGMKCLNYESNMELMKKNQ